MQLFDGENEDGMIKIDGKFKNLKGYEVQWGMCISSLDFRVFWQVLALSIPQVRKWLGVEKEAMDYFASGVPTMVSFYQAHKHDKSKHLIIR